MMVAAKVNKSSKIRELVAQHPDWPAKKIADKIGVGVALVYNVKSNAAKRGNTIKSMVPTAAHETNGTASAKTVDITGMMLSAVVAAGGDVGLARESLVKAEQALEAFQG